MILYRYFIFFISNVLNYVRIDEWGIFRKP